MMKKILNIMACGVLITAAITGCKKADPLTGTDTTPISYVSFTNANASGKIVNFFLNGTKLNFAIPGATIAGTYAGVVPDKSQYFSVSDTAAPYPSYYAQFVPAVAAGRSYSFYTYDTLVAGSLKGILLSTDRTYGENSPQAKIRFLHFNPKAPVMDVVMVRQVSNGAGTPALIAKDSVLIASGAGYIGSSTPNINALSAFVPLTASQLANSGAGNLQTNYVVKFKAAGTSTVLASATLTLVPEKNYSLLLRGNSATAFTLTLQLNN